MPSKASKKAKAKTPPRLGGENTGFDNFRNLRIETIGDVSDVLTHESNNLLGALKTCVQMLRKNPHITADDAELLDVIQRGSDRLSEILSDFSALGRPSPLHFQKLNLNTIIEDTLRRLQGDDRCCPSIVMHRQLDPSIRLVKADHHRLEKLFWHLFLNAAQAMGDRGQLTVKTHTVDRAIEISVCDIGTGIPAKLLTKIFEPLYTTKTRGAGLGLALVHRIVEEHGGRITVYSEPGSGTCFTVTLLIDPEAVSHEDQKENRLAVTRVKPPRVPRNKK
jgi:signal transduction histidine kinase